MDATPYLSDSFITVIDGLPLEEVLRVTTRMFLADLPLSSPTPRSSFFCRFSLATRFRPVVDQTSRGRGVIFDL